MMDVRVLDVRPHPYQATNNPGCWAVQFRVVYDNQPRTFWRWHNVRRLNENGFLIKPDNKQPSRDEIIAQFWEDTFAELHGFSFNKDDP